ncbi:hypothetical protein HYE02_03740 [Mycoplasmopsis bovis]|nr:hypothetical protein HYE02_03740 [Mycoplasmopsis bovis]
MWWNQRRKKKPERQKPGGDKNPGEIKTQAKTQRQKPGGDKNPGGEKTQAKTQATKIQVEIKTLEENKTPRENTETKTRWR